MISIVDYGMGNLGSIHNMLKKIGEADTLITDDAGAIRNSDGIILPGVGAYDMGVRALAEKGLDVLLKELVNIKKTPILGICLGMQLLGNGSEEGILSGLGLIDFECIKFNFSDNLHKVPHMGWNYVEVENECELTKDIDVEPRYYFVHSYKAVCNNKSDVLMSCEYGDRFVAAVHRDNIYGVQFHPEKSHRYGMNLMKNFVEVCKNV